MKTHMKSIALTTAILLGLGAPALAQNLTAEQFRLQTAMEDGDWAYVNFLRGGGGNGAADVTAIQLATAEQDDEHYIARFLRDGGRESVSTQSFGTSPGAAQLAASLGVEPGRFTTAELIDLRSAMENDEHYRVRAILGN